MVVVVVSKKGWILSDVFLNALDGCSGGGVCVFVCEVYVFVCVYVY